jgi:hypothetical protein
MILMNRIAIFLPLLFQMLCLGLVSLEDDVHQTMNQYRKLPDWLKWKTAFERLCTEKSSS